LNHDVLPEAGELTRISHTFFQNKREAADFLSFPYFGEKQSVCGAC
jgi:hypothetical protein